MENNLELKKKIFENRNFIRVISFFSILSFSWFLFLTFFILGLGSIDNDYMNMVYHDCFAVFLSIAVISTIVSWILNTIFFYNVKKTAKIKEIYIPIFAISFLVNIVVWVVGLSLMHFIKKNKVNYLQWIKEEKNQRIEKRIYKFKNNFDY